MKVIADYKYLPEPTIEVEMDGKKSTYHYFRQDPQEDPFYNGWQIVLAPHTFGYLLDQEEEIIKQIDKQVMDHLQSNFQVFYTPLSEVAAKIDSVERHYWDANMGFSLNDPDPTVWINNDGLPF